jgi:hypothetical protein
MTKLGRVSRETKGIPMTGYAETPDLLTPGQFWPKH